MRFDDRLSTIIAQARPSDIANPSLWAQLIDLLARSGLSQSATVRQDLIRRAEEMRPVVPLERRTAVARSVARPDIPGDVVALFGKDQPKVAAPILIAANLSEKDWAAIIPDLVPTSRALLRERRNLPASTVRLLSSFGPADFALPGDASNVPNAALDGSIPIRDLVARIEAFQLQRASSASSSAPVADRAIDRFRFETDRDGLITWVDTLVRGSLIGMSIGDLAQPGSYGVDGHATGAFRKRTAFTDARLLLPDAAELGGHWLISGQPIFNAEDGRFTGYRGVARRPLAAEDLNAQLIHPFGVGLKGDSLRQFTHELRTPINAISGFAGMIDAQLLGPAAQPYRKRARLILVEAEQLDRVIADADLAARLDTGLIDVAKAAAANLGELLPGIVDEFTPYAARKGVLLAWEPLTDGLSAGVDPESCHRMVSRLLTGCIDAAGVDETVSLGVARSGHSLEITVRTPAALSGKDLAALLNPDPHANHRPISETGLGLAFSLRLVDNLAKAWGGRFIVKPQHLALILPFAQDSAQQVVGVT